MSKIVKNKLSLNEYLSFIYPIVLYSEPEGGFTAEIVDLPGCLTQSETIEEVYEFIDEARQLWIEVAYEEGIFIPLPSTENTSSGKFVVRLPKSLHHKLAVSAEAEAVSLNQYVVSRLSETHTTQQLTQTMMVEFGELHRKFHRLENQLKAVQWKIEEPQYLPDNSYRIGYVGEISRTTTTEFVLVG